MILVLDDGHQVDSKDTEAMEKAASIQEQEALEAAAVAAEALDKSAEKGELTPEKAKKILKDGEVHGKPLTDQQRKYFGAVAGGTARKSDDGPSELGPSWDQVGTKSMDGIEALDNFSKAIYIGPRGGRWLDPKHTIPWKAEGAKTPAKPVEKPKGKRPAKGKPASELDSKLQASAEKIASRHSGEMGEVMYSAKANKLQWVNQGALLEGESIGYVKVTGLGEKKPEAAKKPSESRAKKVDAAIRAMGEKLSEYGKPGIPFKDLSPSEKTAVALMEQRGHAVTGGKGNVTLTTRGAMERDKPAPKKSLAAKHMKAVQEKKRLSTIRSKAESRMQDLVREAKDGTPEFKQAQDKLSAAEKEHETAMRELMSIESKLEKLDGGKAIINANYEKKAATKKSLTAWLTEQETDMTNETELLKALGDDAELVKGMMGYGGRRITEWADQFYDDTGLEVQALQCVKDKIACQKRWDAHHKAAKPWREVEDMPRKAREAYRDKQSKAREVISKEEGVVHMKMRDLEEKLVDYRIKQASMRQAMGKGGFETLDDFAKSESDAVDVEVVKNESGTSVLVSYLEKAQGTPGMEHGPEDGADLSLVQPIVEPGAVKKKPIERITGKSMSVAGHQRELVAHENAQVVSALRKGPADITLGPGVPTPQREPEPVVKSTHRVQGEDSLLIYGDGSDEAASRLAKGDDFWSGGNAPTIGCNPMILNQRKRCAACKAVMSKSLAVCPHCGDGAGIPRQGAVRIEAGAVRNGPTLQPARGEQDITIV